MASTETSSPNVVNIYDSSQKDADSTTKATLAHLMGIRDEDLQINMANMMQQVGGADCGISAAAALTSLAHGDKGTYNFNQEDMRAHLIECIEKCKLIPFPTTNN